MPTEVTIEGAQKIFGLPKTLSVEKQTTVKAAESVNLRQDLPAGFQPAPLSNGAQEGNTPNEEINTRVSNLNAQMQNIQRDLQFSVDTDSGNTIIRVIDSETRETIRTIPAEDIAMIAQRLDRHSGALFNTRV